MRLRVCLALAALVVLGAGAAPAGAVSFAAAVLAPVAGPPFAAPDVVAIAPAGGGWALTLTRAVDATSPRLARARLDGTHFQTIGVAWSPPGGGGVQSLCLGDVALTSYATRRSPGAGRAIEHATLFFAGAARAAGPDACRRLPPPRPVVVRLFSDRAGRLRARVDCLLARCAGVLRLLCPSEGCPAGGVRVGAFALAGGQERILPVTLTRRSRARHPRLTAAVTLGARRAPILAPVILDPPPPPRLPTLTSTAPSPSPSPTPPATPPPSRPPASPGAAPTSQVGVGPGAVPLPVSGPIVGGPGAGPGSGPIDTSLRLSCDGPASLPSAVHGVLDPSLAGQPIEIDYVPVDPSADTVVHHVTTRAGGRFADAPGSPFVSAVAFFLGDDTYVSSDAVCP